jgi:hypothetical protein
MFASLPQVILYNARSCSAWWAFLPDSPTNQPPTTGVGNYLSNKEKSCLDNCARRFLETTQFVVKYYQSKARAGGGEGGFQ